MYGGNLSFAVESEQDRLFFFPPIDQVSKVGGANWKFISKRSKQNGNHVFFAITCVIDN